MKVARRLHVLVVSQELEAARATASWLRNAGYEATIRSTFASGRLELRQAPDLVIADVHLGAFNGLHLAMRAQSEGIPSIVLGPQDPVLEKDARLLGSSYIAGPIGAHALLSLVENLASMVLPRSRAMQWGTPAPAATPAGIPARDYRYSAH
jgi:DNA-binding response OmpR family regulator